MHADGLSPFLLFFLTLYMTVQVPEWILVLGGAGIVTGLALYGYKVGQCPESDLPCIHMHPQTGQDGGLP